ncbi:ethanolamine ammonia-lyase subunit EutC [Bradyrhizobium sp. CB82]|uniref:ethanolamine ammonia-lyase subunit EutC n=1 Tax=Bradyrhizobium sp. CB82 TaxID=3039159 RepID=UPI0024B20145|nr:ethanolamine ammonia-lyase subunit EutC [Bradyrhizobium sp. CB82]WFU39610.1 ethanolamine ammonia-lyase subunit EutC [Bradyrhizobium sp. CB82]
MMPDRPPDESGQLAVANHLAPLRRFTPARIGLGRAGSGQLTATSLQFMLDHARARDAVHAALDFEALGQSLGERDWRVARVHSAARDRTEYLRRPDLGRRLSASGRSVLESSTRGDDIAIIAADGLSALAIETNLLPVLDCLRPLLVARGRTIGPLVLVDQGRVAIGDEIGQLLDAKLTMVLIGERPGLSAADSLGAYITWRPRIGTMDSTRNCISNIRPAGLSPEAAAAQILDVVEQAFAYGATGVRLKDLRSTAPGLRAIANAPSR